MDLCGNDGAAAGAAVATDGAVASSTSGASADTVVSEAPIVDNSVVVVVVGYSLLLPVLVVHEAVLVLAQLRMHCTAQVVAKI